ncbi:chromate transporter [Sporosalibacterium faouarense]|uniref:chromate transporter n=1 Tax=Sporosalibacterium faouarense TaxID=516123 RepID=UPI001A9C4D59|nr:chromate transporter [Sporosalibacterium faouarense]
MSVYWKIFLAFLRPGLFGFGGGPAFLPLIQEEVVERYQWLSVQEFTDAIALANTLPGPLATKMATLVGFKVGGLLGSLIGLLAMLIPSTVAILLLAKVYLSFKDKPWMQGMMRGVRPVVVALIAYVVWTMSQKSFPNIQTGIIAAIAAVAIFFFNVHPIILIVAALTYGAIFLG